MDWFLFQFTGWAGSGRTSPTPGEPKQCEHVTKIPVYIKKIGNMVIDRSEWEGDKGAFFRYEETSCKFVADPGHKYCPRHELEHLASDDIQGRPA